MSFKRAALPDAAVFHWPGFFDSNVSERFVDALISEVKWSQEPIRIFGRELLQPRLLAWYGDPGCAYRYSGRTNTPQAWIPSLIEIRTLVENAITSKLPEYRQAGFNSVLLNRYRNGNDSMGWHADNEIELGPDPLIASVSFGASRSFRLRHNFRRDIEPQVFHLGHGDLLVMGGETQAHWKHQIPPTKKPVGERVNLTFRYIIPEDQR